jgi:hypothetical protein
MEAIELQPCHFRGDVPVPVKGESARRLSWAEAIDELVPPADRTNHVAEINLRFARIGDYVGVRSRNLRGQGVLSSFVISRHGDDFGWLYKRYPEFPRTVEKIYRVESVIWKVERITEPSV